MPTIRQRDSTPGDETPTEIAGATPGRQTADQLDYLTDMIAELRTMAQNGHLMTLAGILSLAHAEAMQQLISRQRPPQG